MTRSALSTLIITLLAIIIGLTLLLNTPPRPAASICPRRQCMLC